MAVYKVNSNNGGAIFKNEDDAISAVCILGGYHGVKIKQETIKKALEKDGYFETFPLSIIKENDNNAFERELFELLLRNYKKKESAYKDIEQVYKKALGAWLDELEKNGGGTEKTERLRASLDKATAKLEEAGKEYNFLAHAVLKYVLN